jgi:hypothetical protein
MMAESKEKQANIGVSVLVSKGDRISYLYNIC